MKKFLLLLSLTASLPSIGQSWAAPGATWYYDYQYFSSQGYERIRNVGDTIINGNEYNKLEIYRQWYDWSSQQSGSFTLPDYEFTREDSGTVYYYRDSAEYVLYNFNAQPGETWVLRADAWISGSMCDTASVVVDSISTMIVNGDTLRMLYTSPINWSGISFMFLPIVEKLGALANLMPYAICVTDIPQGYNLRCYSDSAGWTYTNPNLALPCDYIMGTAEHVQQDAFLVIPDAGPNKLSLTGSAIEAGALITVYDSRGQLLSEETAMTNGSAEVNFSGEASGIFFVVVTTNEARLTQSVFIPTR